MKKSAYNIIVSNEYGNLIVNTMTGAIAKLSDREKECYNNDNFSPNMLEELYYAGFYVEEDTDEIKILNDVYLSAKDNKKDARITICPTLECNFKCPYCYESRIKGHMSKEVQELVLNHIKGLYLAGIELIHITWYGGEPLLYQGIMEYMSQRIIDIAKEQGGFCEFNIITNGYLISEKTIELFKSVKMSSIQITIDGNKDIHDKRRVLMNGNPTYEVIKSNILQLVSNGFSVNVRINIDKDNASSYQEVQNVFGKIEGVHCYPAFVTTEEVQSEEQREKCFHGSEYKNIIGKYHLDYDKIDIEKILRPEVSICMACHNYSYVYGFDGNVFKCINDVCNLNSAIFNLKDINAKIEKSYYQNRSPFHEKECIECKILPLCYGKCAWEYRKKDLHSCPDIKYMLEDILKNKYLRRED